MNTSSSTTCVVVFIFKQNLTQAQVRQVMIFFP